MLKYKIPQIVTLTHENGNAIRDYDTAKRIRRRVTLQQKQFKDYSICNQLLLNIL